MSPLGRTSVSSLCDNDSTLALASEGIEEL